MNAICTTNFNFLKEKSVLLISKDINLIKNINYNLFENLKELEIVNSILNITSYSKYDLIIVDTDDNDLFIISSILSTSAKEIPVILITSEMHNKILDLSDYIKLRNIILKDINTDYIKYYVALTLKKTTIVNFNDGYYFDMNKDKLYCNGRDIKLTLLETQLFKYLIDNRKKIVSYEEIKNSVWGERKFTIFGMRNIINKIREKSYYDIITNVSKSGYIIQNYHIFS